MFSISGGKKCYKLDLVPARKCESIYIIQKYDISFNTQKFRFLSHTFQLSHIRAGKNMTL